MRMGSRVAMLLLALAPVGAAQEQDSPAVTFSPGLLLAEWGADLPIAAGVGEQMALFERDGTSLEAPFVKEQALRFRQALFAAAQSGINRIDDEGCQPSIEATFPDPDEWDASDIGPSEKGFLSGVVRTEAVACFDSEMTPQAALDLYTSPEFRMEAESRIVRMWNEGETSCLATSGVRVLLDPTEVCNAVTRLAENGLSAEHSHVVRNGTDEGLQLTYFKESLKTFVKTPEGVALHYINYSRSVDLGRASRWIAPGKVRESQERQIEALRGRIGR